MTIAASKILRKKKHFFEIVSIIYLKESLGINFSTLPR